ncbi:hypothetical protein [Aureimonas phyllosphaerae]|uniref:Uncharacterized protein n=1 Tax=Aureimonas phyllosphaerae TaxID=1166078 RepID=A0A7W6BVJ3_9HYPH|nr:hypothetical protein [Aureimonas phyllosphaerae]MBB3937702.1 hypothetical protein [Aureimonas phyllosphaerae]MBB3961763.1 hypothetical protein [Aureimonas phyllosphaerae]SFF45222.1 hypothetical protein SAMN05216566_11440 [Aureimonas phyllosphaerae]
MIGFLKAKARAVVLTAAGVLLALQIILPTTLDLLLGLILLGLVWVATRLT